MFLGTGERVTKEPTALAPSANFPVAAPPESMMSVWIGTSILFALSTFQLVLMFTPFFALSANSVESPARSLFCCVTDIAVLCIPSMVI